MNIEKLKMNAEKTKYMVRSIRKELRDNITLKCWMELK